MKIIKTNGGYLERDELNYMGGRVSFIKALKIGGIGSPKIQYLSGINEIDVVKDTNLDLNYVNIEILNKGIVIRYHKHYSSITALILFEEIQNIEISRKKYDKGAFIVIKSLSFAIELYAAPSFKSQVEAFFRKECFMGKFVFLKD